mgnify:CR=1 FL=1
MITKQRIDHELYVYFNGQLIYKRWIYSDYSYGKVFDQTGGY